jgi:hypothetical protein
MLTGPMIQFSFSQELVFSLNLTLSLGNLIHYQIPEALQYIPNPNLSTLLGSPWWVKLTAVWDTSNLFPHYWNVFFLPDNTISPQPLL